ncbi:MAG: NAD-dependent epimerase/dehydratase family protein [Ignavibacteria bacterium]
MINVLITGATGFIGSHIADELLKRNYKIKCLVRKTSNLQWLKDKPVEFVYGSLFDNEILTRAVENVDYIYHSAGITFAKKKSEYFKGNTEAVKNIIEVCYKVNPKIKKFVHISSQAAVGPALSESNPVDENTGYHPITTYGRSKTEAEKIVKSYFDKMNCTIIRPPAVYGPRDVAVFEYFKSISRGLMPLIGFGSKLVSLIHSSDLVNGITLAGESVKANSNIYFISSEKFYSWRNVGELTSRLMNKKVLRVVIPHFTAYTVGFFSQVFAMFSKKPAILNIEKTKDITQTYWICSAEKARHELGFKEKLTLEEGFKNTIEWYKKKGWIK